VTAIRLGNTGYNPAIPFDPGAPNWTPLAITAADPSYPGAHSTISQAAATILTAFFGTDQPITVTSDNLPGVTRSFASLQAAADQAGLSRIFAGQHTILDHQAGQTLGRQIAEFTLRHLQTGHVHPR
jgi:membrane-associated phospholipid phosphatase